MYLQNDHMQIIGMVKERNRLFRALQEIQQITENNSDSQSQLITTKCKEALKSEPNILSKSAKQFIEEYEWHLESILSGEIYEKFEV